MSCVTRCNGETIASKATPALQHAKRQNKISIDAAAEAAELPPELQNEIAKVAGVSSPTASSTNREKTVTAAITAVGLPWSGWKSEVIQQTHTIDVACRNLAKPIGAEKEGRTKNLFAYFLPSSDSTFELIREGLNSINKNLPAEAAPGQPGYISADTVKMRERMRGGASGVQPQAQSPALNYVPAWTGYNVEIDSLAERFAALGRDIDEFARRGGIDRAFKTWIILDKFKKAMNDYAAMFRGHQVTGFATTAEAMRLPGQRNFYFVIDGNRNGLPSPDTGAEAVPWAGYNAALERHAEDAEALAKAVNKTIQYDKGHNPGCDFSKGTLPTRPLLPRCGR